MPRSKIKVLVVDDSPLVRKVVSEILLESPSIAAVETAPNGRLALRKVAKFDPDVVTLDVEMPGMNGLAVLRSLMSKAPRPVIMLSAFTFEGASKTIRALELGAVDFIQKPGGRLSRDMREVGQELVEKILAVAYSPTARRIKANARPAKGAPRGVVSGGQLSGGTASGSPSSRGAKSIVAIGASTGGTDAIFKVLSHLPADFPVGVVVVQHMPQGFTKAFSDRMNELCTIEVKEASHRDMIVPGRVLIAPGHSHMVVRLGEQGAYVELNRRPEVSGHRPSVDVLFLSVAEAFGDRAVAALLTGMGRDGAIGMRQIHDAGGFTIAQDEKSCVVYGMPRAAVEMEAADTVVDLLAIPTVVKRCCAARSPEGAGVPGKKAGSLPAAVSQPQHSDDSP